MVEQSVTLNPGESKLVIFEATSHEARTYQVAVNGLTGSFVAIEGPGFYWLLPTGHADPSNRWANEPLAYDGWTETYAETQVAASSWSSFLEFTITPTEISALRWWASAGVSPAKIQVDAYYNGAWHNIYEGSAVHMWDNGMAIPDGTQVVSKARIRTWNPIPVVYGKSVKARINEFQFYGYSEVPPAPPEAPPTTKLFGYVTDTQTGAPIVGVSGTVYQDYDTKTKSYDFTTDSSGYYLIDNMLFEVDVTQMVIYATGYQTYANEHVSIVKGDNQLNVRMTPL